MLYVQMLYDTDNDAKLQKISPREYFRRPDRANTSAEGIPTQWTHVAGGSYRGYLYLYPTPDDAYAITRYYRALPTALTGSNTTVIGTEWDEVILRASVWLGKKKLRYSIDEIQNEKAILDGMVNDIKGLYDAENLDIDERVQPHPAWLIGQK